MRKHCDPFNPLQQNKTTYCMKPPNIKAPKCTLFSIQCFIFQGQRSQVLTGLATAHCEHRWGQLTLESPFRSLRVAEAKNVATINCLMSERRNVLYFPYSTLFSRVKGHKGSPVLPRLLPNSEHSDGQLTSESPFRIVESS